LTASAPRNNARFRVADDTIVGAYPLPEGTSTTGQSWRFSPFVAVRAFVTEAAALGGTYNRIELTQTPGAGPAPMTAYGVRQVKISANGLDFWLCNETGAISRINSCAGTVVHYASTGVPAGYYWTFVNDADPSDMETFVVARIGGENVLLQAGNTVGTARAFRIGLPDMTAWPTQTSARGGDDFGGWSNYQFTTTSFAATGFDIQGTSTSAALALLPSSLSEPSGLLRVDESPSMFFALRSAKLLAMIGGRSWYGGYFQIGLVD
jgi:hypothetical protein